MVLAEIGAVRAVGEVTSVRRLFLVEFELPWLGRVAAEAVVADLVSEPTIPDSLLLLVLLLSRDNKWFAV